MSIFDYKNALGSAGKTQYSDAITLALYASNPTGEPLPGTAWRTISAAQLDYQGNVDAHGTISGEQASVGDAQVEILGKYDASGQLLSIGISFRGTDSLADAVNDLQAAFSPGFADNYSRLAFDNLLGKVAAFAAAQGLDGKDVLVTGHSLGGLGVNSLAAMSGEHWGGFFQDASYVAFASPTQSADSQQVLNIGYENDPVFRVLDGTHFNGSSLGTHDRPQESATNNIVSFTDHYSSLLGKLLPQSILNPSSWSAHSAVDYAAGLNRLIASDFYDLTSRDSTVVISNLSEGKRDQVWVKDLNLHAEQHTGSTFIIGSEGNDLLHGGKGNDYLDGGAGDDRFRDDGGYNIIHGGQGHNVLELRQPLQNFSIANDGDGSLYVRDAYGGISMTRDIGALVSHEKGSFWQWFGKDVTYDVTADGLFDGQQWTAYNHSLNGDAYGNSLVASVDGDWLFGQGGDDLLSSDKANVTFVGGSGNDVMHSGGGGINTFLFSGHFGLDLIHGYQASDKLVFMGVPGVDAQYDYSQHLSQSGNDTLLKVGDYSVTLVGVGMEGLDGSGIIFA
ncbi:polyurethanase [Pseudomonas sp. L5B5]|uniref:polyurethane esterase n=1 Tax=Pseudomonas sp. L5B5 TaxID=2883205 RepID=UPI00072FC4E7|nr:polyurethanase [Pseudomonas sp. L5B5]KTC42215.1 polyurethanase [Pseudomonas sp. ABAC61]UCZ85547.1 polyurethanase [Pseudomonas sp. L5B5]